MSQDFNNWEDDEIKKEIEADWIAARAEKIADELMKDEEIFREAIEHIMMIKDGEYVSTLFDGLNIIGDTSRVTLIELFSEYCSGLSKTLAQDEADKLAVSEMKSDISTTCSRKAADESLINALMGIAMTRLV